MHVISDLKARKKPASFKPFPTCALPEPVSTYIEEGSKALGCDTSYIALPMLSALASSIGNSRRIKLKESWSEPAILWTGIVGDSGTMKSPAIELALKPLRKKQTGAFKEYAEQLKDYQGELAEYEQTIKQKKKSDPLPDKPIEPIAMRYYCGDITIEALAGLLNNSPRGLLLARDELSGWLKSFNAYKNGKGSDDAQWLELHRAGTLLVDRKSGTPKTIHISNASVGGLEVSYKLLCPFRNIQQETIIEYFDKITQYPSRTTSRLDVFISRCYPVKIQPDIAISIYDITLAEIALINQVIKARPIKKTKQTV